MTFAAILTRIAAELALFSAAGFLLFSLNDIAVDLIYFARRLWRSATVYRRFPRTFGQGLAERAEEERFVAIFVPAWDESTVIAPMLRATLARLNYGNYRIFVGHYRNDPATKAAIASVDDERIEPVLVHSDGPTTKADCLNHLYDALIAFELREDRPAAAVVLHDAEDVVHPLELAVFNSLLDRAAIVQLPVLPLPDRNSRWIAGHYCDEFAEAHSKELVVREAVGAAIPLAGVGCAIARAPLARLAAMHEGYPFAGASMTEDYEFGLRVGELGEKTIFVRMPAVPGSPGVVASRGHFPSTFGEAVRQKARWLGGIALTGWDRLGWRGGIGERWMRMRDRRGPIAALLLLSGYLAVFLWSQMWLAEALGAPIRVEIGSALSTLLWINLWLLLWRVLMRVVFTVSAYGWSEGLIAIPRMVVGNFIAIAAAARALGIYLGRAQRPWDKTRHIFSARSAVRNMSAPVRFLAVVLVGWTGVRAATLGLVPGFTVTANAEPQRGTPPPIIPTQFASLPPASHYFGPQQLEPAYAASGPPRPVVYYIPYPYAMQTTAPTRIPPRPQWKLPSGRADESEFFTANAPLEDWQLASAPASPQRQSRSISPAETLRQPNGSLDRVQMTSWALLRGSPSPGALATGGTLGGSQAGARLTYKFNRWVAASLRTTTPVGGSRGAEVAAGLRFVPFRSVPIAITAERRQAISPHGGGRSAFALFAEAGLYHQPAPLDFNLDAYVQAGVVGLKSRDLFVDGAFAFTRPLWGRFSAGFGVWGGAQPGLYRVDAGPRIGFRIRDNIYAYADWRQKLVGNAQPGSGPALTLAADF